jgi:tetratricopeptide (TPR) repeat protein
LNNNYILMLKKLAIILILLGCSILLLQKNIDVAKKELKREELKKFRPPRSDLVKLASLGYHNLLADFFWMETVQYRAECGNRKVKPDQLYPRVNFITDLDPVYTSVYLFGAITIMMEKGEREEVSSLLEKCKRQCKKSEFECPFYYKIPYTLGYHYYFFMGEYEKAALNLEEAESLSKIAYYGLLASRIRAEGGRPELGIAFLENALRQTEDKHSIRKYKQRIKELGTTIIERDLNTLRENIELQSQVKIQNINDMLAPNGPLTALPKHPLENHVFIFDNDKGEIRSEPPVETNVHKNPLKKI